MRIVHCTRLLLFAMLMLAMPVASFAQVSISVNFAPPELPVHGEFQIAFKKLACGCPL